jgi:magnesium transporter
MMFPTLIASLFGMNLVNGMEEKPFGFITALVISVGVSAAALWFFKHKRLV